MILCFMISFVLIFYLLECYCMSYDLLTLLLFFFSSKLNSYISLIFRYVSYSHVLKNVVCWLGIIGDCKSPLLEKRHNQLCLRYCIITTLYGPPDQRQHVPSSWRWTSFIHRWVTQMETPPFPTPMLPDNHNLRTALIHAALPVTRPY